jgi:hypothetical protein
MEPSWQCFVSICKKTDRCRGYQAFVQLFGPDDCSSHLNLEMWHTYKNLNRAYTELVVVCYTKQLPAFFTFDFTNPRTYACSATAVYMLMTSFISCSTGAFYDLQGHRGCRGLMPENTIPAFLRRLI